jgi:hypothetical protein
MPESCNCGAQLAEGALFCHKCGRPLRDIPDPESTGAIPVMKIEPVYPPVNFHNPIAVRVGLLMAVAATAVFFLPLLNWMGAGFFSSLLYRRRTGYLLNLESGLRLGWITGVLMFVIVLVMMTVSFAMINTLGVYAMADALPPPIRDSMGSYLRESMRFFENPARVAQMVVMDFISVTLFSMAGAALGARVSRRDPEGPMA